MSDLTLYFQFEPGPGIESGNIAQELHTHLQGIESVEAAKVSTAKARLTGLEIAAAITLAVQIVHNAKQISDDVKAIAGNVEAVFETVRKMARELKAKDVSIPVNGERKSILHGNWNAEDYLAIAEDIAAGDGA